MAFEVRAVQAQMQSVDHYAQLANEMNRELAEHSMTNAMDQELRRPGPGIIGGLIVTLAVALAGGVAGTAAGVGAVCLGIFLLMANPGGWAFVAGGLAGGVIGGKLGSSLAGDAAVNDMKRSQAFNDSMHHLVYEIAEIQRQHLETGVAPIQKIHEFKDELIGSGYLLRCDDNGFTFNEAKFTEIGSWYEEERRDQVKHSTKFVIISALASLPTARRPTDMLIQHLSALVNQLANAQLKSTAEMTLAMLHIDKQDPINAYRRFSLVPQDGHWYARSQTFMRILEERFPEVRAQLR